MKTIKLALFLTLAALLSGVETMLAVPANPEPHTFVQPDGTKVTLRLIGDEFYHFYLTDDDQMVMPSGKGFYFAEIGKDGKPCASKVLATDKAHRSAHQTSFVNSINRDALRQKAALEAKEQRAQRTVTKAANPFRSPAKEVQEAWASKGKGKFSYASFPLTGSPHLCVILVEYQDVKFKMSNPRDYFVPQLNTRGFSNPGTNATWSSGGVALDLTATGSALDFFSDSSNGVFTPVFDVYGPVTLPNNMAYYGEEYNGADDHRPAHMIRDAVQLLDPDVDFTQYDTDGDDEIDMVYVIFAGLGQANGGAPDTIWPHAWYVKSGAGLTYKADGKLLDHYACSGELYYESGDYYMAEGIGTFCHEFSHVLGLPDEYDIGYGEAYSQSLTPGQFSLMDGGSYNNNGRTPPSHSIFQRNALGWADIDVLPTSKGLNIEMGHTLQTNLGYAVETGNVNEFFLLENRQLSRWDAALPGHGMLIWHIDFNQSVWDSNSPNVDPKLQRVNLVSANNDPTKDAGRPFPGNDYVRTYDFFTNAGTALNIPLSAITESNSNISFMVNGGEVSKPVASIEGVNITETSVEKNSPFYLTLTAQTGYSIKYLYMTEDEMSDDPVTYTAPIYIDRDMTVEFWAVRNSDGLESDVTEIEFTVTQTDPDPNPDPDPDPDPTTGPCDEYTFDFTGDTAYGMTLYDSTNSKNGNEEIYNENGLVCEGTHVSMTLNGNTRWWKATNNNELRFHKGSSFDLTAGEGYRIINVQTDGVANDWEPSSFTGFADNVSFVNKKSTKNTAIKTIDVKLVAIPSFLISDVVVSREDDVFHVNCHISHSNSDHVSKYVVWVVETTADYEAREYAPRREAAANTIGSVEVSGDDITEGSFAVKVPLTLESNTGMHRFAVRAHALVAGDNPVYTSNWEEGNEPGVAGHEYYGIDTNTGIMSNVGGISADDSNVRYYNLQGERIQTPTPGETVIRIANGKAEKTIAR